MRLPALPRRFPLLLLAAALALLLALPAVHDAPTASASHTDTVWSATLTLQDLSQVPLSGLGCATVTSGAAAYACSNESVLTDDDFTFLGEDWVFTQIAYQTDAVLLEFTENATADLGRLTLHVGSQQIPLAEHLILGTFIIDGTFPALNAGDTLDLKLTFEPDHAGDLDPDFGIGGKVTTAFDTVKGEIFDVAEQSDGKIVAVGYVDDELNTLVANDFAVARFNPDGSLDNTFGNGGWVTTDFPHGGSKAKNEARAVAVQSDGKIVVAGFTSGSGGNQDFALVRYTSTGTLDGNFGSFGKVTTSIGSSHDVATALALQSDGKIVAAGYATWADRNFAAVRYNADGTLDTTFDTDGKKSIDVAGAGHDDAANAVAIDGSNRIVLAGYANNGTNDDFAVLRLTTAGAADTSFSSNGQEITPIGSANDRANGLVLQSDGKIVVAGYSLGATHDAVAVARYTTAGYLDTSFSTDGKVTTSIGPATDRANAVALDGDGKIVVAGYSFSGGEDFAVARYTTAGALDTAFSSNSNGHVTTDFVNASDVARAVAVLSDGTILAAGYANNGSVNEFALARYTSIGIPHDDFGIGGKVTASFGGNADWAYAVAVQSDGKIVVAGEASNIAHLTRYNPDGSLDAGFGTGGRQSSGLSGSHAHAVAVQPDGKILVAGYAFDGLSSFTDDFLLARFTAAGALDTTFGTGGKVLTHFGSGDDRAHAMALLSDGKILVAGYASNGTDDDFALARYTSAGALDTTFGTGGKRVTDFHGNDDQAHAMAVQSDGKIVLAGYANSSTGEEFALARYTAAGDLDTDFGAAGTVTKSFSAQIYDRAQAVAVDGDGRIVAAGIVGNDSSGPFLLARFGSDGAPDGDFGAGGRVTTDFGGATLNRARSMALLADGKILVAGESGTSSVARFSLARYRANGTLDTGFGAAGNGKVTTPFGPHFDAASAMALQTDGKIVLAGQARIGGSQPKFRDFAVARYLGQGTYSTDATLSALEVTPSTDGSAFSGVAGLTPAFDPETTAYDAALAEGVTHVKIVPTTAHTAATVEVVVPNVSTETVASGSGSAAIAVAGVSAVEVRVTAEDGRTTMTYTLTFSGDTAGGPGEGPGGEATAPVRFGDAWWSATLTIRDLVGNGRLMGCSNVSRVAAGDRCNSPTTLTRNSFILGGVTHTVDGLFVDLGGAQPALTLVFDAETVPANLRHGAVLVFGVHAFRLADADLSSGTLKWSDIGISSVEYADDLVVEVSLRAAEPDAANWRPTLDVRQLEKGGQSWGCRNGVPAGDVYGGECSDPAILGGNTVSYTRIINGEAWTETYQVHELYTRPSGHYGGRTAYEMVLTMGTYPTPPSSFVLVVDGRRFWLKTAQREKNPDGSEGLTYRWPLDPRDTGLSYKSGPTQVRFAYPRTSLDSIRVHYDGSYETTGEFLSATLTAANHGFGQGLGGCSNSIASAACSSTSVLTDDEFTYQDVDYAITSLDVNSGILTIVLNKAIPAALKSALTLHVGSREFPLADATLGSNDTTLSWSNTGLSQWAVGDTVQLRLTGTERVLGADDFRSWAKPGVSAVYHPALIAVVPGHFPSRDPAKGIVTTTHVKFRAWAASPGSTMEIGKGTHDTGPATYTALADGELSEAIELDTATSYTHIYIRVTNGDQVAVHHVIVDPPPRTYKLAPEVRVAEGDDAAITLTLGSAAPAPGVTFDVTVDYVDGGATPEDVGAVPTTVTVPGGETSVQIVIPTVDDDEVEDLLEHEERFTVSVSHSGYPSWAEDPNATATAVVTIVDNDEPPDGPEPWNIKVVPGDGTLTVTWRVGNRPGVDDDDIRHALRWSQQSGVWNNPRDPRGIGPNDGVAAPVGATSYVITDLENGVPTGVFVRSFRGHPTNPDAYNISEGDRTSSEWVRTKGEHTTPRAPERPTGPVPPTVSAPIADAAIVNESGTHTVPLSGVFDDANGDALTLTAASSDTATATASVSADQSTLTVTAKARGTATVTVTADDGNGGTVSDEFTVTVKAAPVVAAALPDLTSTRVESLQVFLSGVFSDADNDALTITVSSSDTAVVYADVWQPDQSGLTLGARARGTATITVTARDADGNAVSDDFTVKLKAAPVVASAIANVSGLDPGATQDVSLSGVFTDADGDAMTITARSSDTARATVTVASDGSKLTLTGVAAGSSTITVTAEDADGNTVSDDFTVTVGNADPPEQNDYADLIARMYEWRNDPQWSSNKDHTDRWDRALLAFGETVADASLTPMTAAEAQGYADRGWQRWVEVAEALKQIEQAQGQQQQPANNAPTVAAPIANATIVNASGTKQVSLSGVFSDADGDSLTITARSSDTATATASVSADQSTLTVTAKARGTATVTVTANDGNGGTVEDEFTVTVKAAPVVASAIADVTGLEAGSTRDVSLSSVFSDADGDALTITARSSDTAKATVTVASDGSKLTLTGVAAGSSTVTVTARDADGNTVSDAFEVAVAAAQQQQQQTPPPGQGPEPWGITIVPGDGTLTVTWNVSSRDGFDDSEIRHALRWSQEPGVWANPRCTIGFGPNDGLCVDGGVYSYTITGLKNGVATGVFIRSFTGDSYSERSPHSSEWVRIKGDNTTPRAPQ